ncbi:MAG: hypothetical protein J6Z49_07860 [Kiritimatiellae bacterium]|nr:hypothetical protein [Kiritimatiellia bacterium]
MNNFIHGRSVVLRAAAIVFAVCLAAFRGAAYVELPIERCMLFNLWTNNVDYGDYYSSDWTHEGGESTAGTFVTRVKYRALLAGTNHTHTSGWSVFKGRTGTGTQIPSAYYIHPEQYSIASVTTNNCQCNLQNLEGAWLRSPCYTEGIGTLYFDIVNAKNEADVVIEIATNMRSRVTHDLHPMESEESDGYVYNWEVISNLTLNVATAGEWVRYRQALDYFGSIRFRIRRTNAVASQSVDDSTVAIDNICVSYPRIGVSVGQTSLVKTPGVLASANVRCAVSNDGFSNSLLPVQYSDYRSRTVTIYFKDADASAVSSAVLTYDGESGDGYGNGEIYTAEIHIPDGSETLEYWFECQVTGNRYFPEDYTLTGKSFWEDGGEPPVMGATAVQTSNVAGWSKSKGVTKLSTDRLMLFNKWTNGVDYGDYYGGTWTHDGPEASATFVTRPNRRPLLSGSNHVHTAGWKVIEGKTGSSSHIQDANYIAPDEYSGFGFTTNWQASLHNMLTARIESPLYTNGIGTIYFDAVNTLEAGDIVVQFATNMVDEWASSYHDELKEAEWAEIDAADSSITNHLWVYDWKAISTNSLDFSVGTIQGVEGFLRYQKTVNIRYPAKFRILRNSTAVTTDRNKDVALLAIDNIQVSVPPADVVIERDVYDLDPGYPAIGQKMTVRCRVSNVDTNNTTMWMDRDVKVVYRWRYLDQSVDAWRTNTMAYVSGTDGDDGEGNGELYVGEIPAQEKLGDLEYYFVCSFDGFRFIPTDYTLLGHTYWPGNPEHSESPSPRSLHGMNAGSEREFYARLRPHKSSIEKMLAVTDFLDEPVEMQLIGDDVWRGYIPLAALPENTNTFNFYFMVTNTYVATTNADGLILHERNAVPRYWSKDENGKATASGNAYPMPTGGFSKEYTEAFWMPIACSGSAYAGVQIDLNTMEYQVCRAEYQNFNDWTGYTNYFARSYGQPDKRPYKENFDTWLSNVDDAQYEYFDQLVPAGEINAYRASFVTHTDWKAYNATYAEEMVQATVSNNPYKTALNTATFRRSANIALRLIGGEAWNSAANENIEVTGAGYVTTLGDTLVDGLKSLDFKARLMTPVTADNIVQYIGTEVPKQAAIPKNYAMFVDLNVLNASGNAQSREPHSISLLAYIQDVGSFYEVRITQCKRDTTKNDLPDANTHSTSARLGIYRWNRGVPRLLKQSDIVDGIHFGSQQRVSICVYSDVASTYIRGYTSGLTLDVEYEDKDNSSLRLETGNPGVMINNCQGIVNNINIAAYTKGVTPTGYTVLSLSPLIASYNWSYDATRYVISDSIISLVPSQTISLYTQPATYRSSNRADPSDNGWTLATNFTVSSYSYQSFSYEPKNARALHVKLQNTGGADVAVDELVLRSWHGKQTGSNDDEWQAKEAWVQSGTPSSRGKIVELDMSRAEETASGSDEEGARQYIVSPYLENGRGQISFDYKVVRPPVQLTVQQRGESGNWTDVPFGSLTEQTATDWVHASVYVGNTNSGYLRIVNDARHGIVNGIVDIDNAIAWDEPAVSDASWVVYNGLVTDMDPSRQLLDASKTLFLNDSQRDVMEGFDLHQPPYLKSPYLVNGLGEIRFEARLYNPTDTRGGTIYVYGLTNDDWFAEDTWVIIDELCVTNVAKQFYTVYVRDPSQFDSLSTATFHAIKLVTSKDGDLPRVCIENVSVQEPVYPGFDIENVRLLYHRNNDEYGYRDQPLTTDMIGIEAELTNIRLSPSNINVYVSYHVGTNTWGVENLWGKPSLANWSPAQSTTIKMVQDETNPQIYRTPFDNDIPFQEENAIVQYCVWATYCDFEGKVYYFQVQKENSFTMPSWYYPMDYNRMYSGWSPYFIVYRIPHGCVFVNELNPYETNFKPLPDGAGCWVNPFLELAIPAQTDLSRWCVDIINGEDLDYNKVVTHIIHMDETGKEEVTNGFAFYVISDTVANQHPPVLPNMDVTISSLAAYPRHFSDLVGAIRIRRPLGMYEHVVAYDMQNGDIGIDYANEDPDGQAVFIGSDLALASLCVTNGCGETINEWCTVSQLGNSTINHLVAFDRNTVVWTPGQPNVCQVLPPIPEIFAGMSNVIVKAVLRPSARGLQNGTTRTLNFKITRGLGSTNIVYDTANWYRIVSLTANETNDLLSSSYFKQNTTTNYTLLVTNILEDTEIVAYVDRDPSILRLGLPLTVRDWLFAYPDSAIVTNSWDIPDNRPLSFTELYWLNCDPTVYNELDGGFTGKVERVEGGSNVYLSVWMTLNGKNVTSLRGKEDIDRPAFKIKVKDDLLSPHDWVFARQYYFGPDTFDSNHTCRLLIDTYPFLDGTHVYDYDRLFFKWVLEFDEAKGTPYWPLTNCPSANP